jgi:hypothetical protein
MSIQLYLFVKDLLEFAKLDKTTQSEIINDNIKSGGIFINSWMRFILK